MHPAHGKHSDGYVVRSSIGYFLALTFKSREEDDDEARSCFCREQHMAAPFSIRFSRRATSKFL